MGRIHNYALIGDILKQILLNKLIQKLKYQNKGMKSNEDRIRGSYKSETCN